MEMTNRSFSVAGIFADHMVLQRDKPVAIWGKSQRAQTLRFLIDGREAARVQAGAGEWKAQLPAMPAQKDMCLEIAGEDTAEPLRFSHTAVGELWIAGGQSNMEFILKYDAEAKAVIAGADDGYIRYYETPRIKFEGQERETDLSAFGVWRRFTPEEAPCFSAVALYFALRLRKQYPDMPIGIVGCSFGGSSAAAWMDERFLAEDEELRIYLDDYRQGLAKLDMRQYLERDKKQRHITENPLAKRLMAWIMKNTPGPRLTAFIGTMLKGSAAVLPVIGPLSENRPAGLYHTMLSRIAGFSARGVIWYQGETDNVKASRYARLFSALIRCWRYAWGEDLPFIFVQLAPFEQWLGIPGTDFYLVREQQEIVSKTVPGTYMASIMDWGSRLDVHPKHKRPVGERLALLALGKVYGLDLLSESPEAETAIISDGELVISFRHAGRGLTVKGYALKSLKFMLDENCIEARGCTVAGNEVRCRIDGLETAKSVDIRFAWENYTEVNLYNSAGLPAKPFRMIVR
ncbi:MAG: sialate O-acetylesterase [Treponema sp.]|jgi:sialate O-acetylesterase|nr:sialate O-acetylesterase [Treponema sp.]